MDDLRRVRRAYAESVLAQTGRWHDGLFEAFATVPREHFLGPGPWQMGVGPYWTTRGSDPVILYQNMLVALDPATGINNGLPSLHAAALVRLDVRPGDRVVHVGAGTGYYSAILAEMAGSRGQVSALEVDAALAARARDCVTLWPQVTVHDVSGLDFPIGNADAIYVNAGLNFFPRAWIDGLALGGRLVMPLTGEDKMGAMVLITRTSRGLAAEFILAVAFVPMEDRTSVARPDAPAEIRRKHASWHEVRSLRLPPEKPDDTCWLDAGDWWLSTRDVAEKPAPPST